MLGLDVKSKAVFSPNSFSHRGSYFKLAGGWGFADFVDSLQGGAVTQGVVGGAVWCVCGGQGWQIQDRAVHTGCQWRVSSGVCRGQRSAVTQGVSGGCCLMCVRLRVLRSKTGLSSYKGVIEADACRGQGFADLREGCHGGCHWRCHLMRPRVGFCAS